MMEVRSDINALTAIEAIGKLSQMEQAYAAITAERDEWKRRLDAVVEMLQPAPDEKLQKMYAEDLHVEYAIRELYPLALAIAEGRDNG